MDIESVVRLPTTDTTRPGASASTSSQKRPEPETPRLPISPNLEARLGKAYAVDRGTNLPQDADIRIALNVDNASGRAYAKVIDKTTGEVIEQMPREVTLRLLAMTREMLGAVYDESV